jgi:hypothetical protein
MPPRPLATRAANLPFRLGDLTKQEDGLIHGPSIEGGSA